MPVSQTSKAAQTPVMQQYLREKAAYPDALLFFRMGDFYELFFEDALTAARALDLTLTSRNKSDIDAIPMCGVPHHAAQTYIPRLLELGHKVAVCEQLEDPSKAKGVVRRGVVRVYSPALVLDGDALDARTNQFLAAVIAPEGGGEMPGAWALAAYDLTTGELFTVDLPEPMALVGELARLDVRELVCPRDAEDTVRPWVAILPRMFVRGAAGVSPRESAEILAAALGAEARSSMEGVSPQARGAAALALRYARESQPGQTIPVQRVGRLDLRDHLHLDETTQQHLEIFRSVRGDKKGSLVHHLDATVTGMGARRLRSWLAFPLQDTRRIRKRHDAVDALVTYPEVRDALRTALATIPDVERIAMRAMLGAATPRDLGLLRDGLTGVAPVLAALALRGDAAEALKALRPGDPCDDLRGLLQGSLADQPPAEIEAGGVFRQGFDEALDRLLALAHDSRNVILGIEQRERESTKIGSLKIRYNKVFGYYIEVTKANLHLVPREGYRRKQTVAGGERFTTDELVKLETEILEAEENARALEAQRFEQLRARVAEGAGRLSKLANVLADADALAAFAEVAHRCDYVRPTVDDGTGIDLRDSRHPVVETLLDPGAFVPNDVALDMKTQRLLLVTGPNMAGKSTLMRQVALIVLMAQAGCFVPAREARIGRVDRIFTRVGASDDLSRGQSTFMVEMRETASILRGATARSLVVFDEIGRGTSTFDGLAIAWAVAEYLHDVVRARSMFATHYHELCSLTETREHVANVNVSARETGDDIVFLHKLAAGGASRSYGVAVARMAGLPEPVLARARALLKDLERGEGPFRRGPKQSGLFDPRDTAPAPVQHPALDAIASVDIDRMTPLDALHFVAQLRAMVPRRE